MVKTIEIAGRRVGEGHPCFIIAEAGVNHNGDLQLAKKLVDTAVSAGADAVKFQTFEAEKIASATAPKAAYQKVTTGKSESQLDMLRQLELSAPMHHELQAYCQEQGILFLSTPFDEDSADFLEMMKLPVFKIPSGEITNEPFLVHIARKGSPMILSTGMANLGEVDQAVRVIRAAGNEQLILLHCVSSYPAQPQDVNLRAMQTLAAAFHTPVGFSDHTTGIEIALAAIALEASVVEKHFTLDRNLPGPDHRASLEPDELTALIQGIRRVEMALGDGRKQPAASEADTAAVARKSLVAAVDIPAGVQLTVAMMAIKRPGTGLPPVLRDHLIGRTAREDIPTGVLLTLEMFA